MHSPVSLSLSHVFFITNKKDQLTAVDNRAPTKSRSAYAVLWEEIPTVQHEE